MRVLSLNAWGGRLHDRLVAYLRDVDADVVCLQEVTRSPGRAPPWLIYRDGGPDLAQRADLFAEAAAALPFHQACFCPAARGELFDDQGRAYPSDWGLATFVRGDIAVIGQAQDFVHGAFAPDGWGGHPRARNAHAVRLFDHAGARTLTIAHMHGLRDPAGKADTPARKAQAQALADLIARVRRQGDGLVVCGDFNVLPGSETFATLGALGLRDLVTANGHDDTRTSWYEKSPRFADYMLVDAGIAVRRFEVVAAPEVSDHRALLLEIG